ncbi:uncharacterized protein LAJ45_09889 [Morchella importuna]|uniref:uncharacterized protein n=1 Tax=Morchella importuna TaxID=1174673 RepID=UPI001E8E1D9A|nr:uncharacterized protein LAJ45_09889 [Morchella importuna]KAH8146191.1 hypothetical protein LAJ45_09889 [Morchella importuna]
MDSLNVFNTKFNLFLKYEMPINRLGEYEAEPLKTYPRDQYEYKFDSHSLRPLYNPFWNLPFVQAYDLHKPYMLHVVYLRILKQLMEWLEDFLKEHGHLDEFNAIWTHMPLHPGFTPTDEALSSSQSMAKEGDT